MKYIDVTCKCGQHIKLIECHFPVGEEYYLCASCFRHRIRLKEDEYKLYIHEYELKERMKNENKSF